MISAISYFKQSYYNINNDILRFKGLLKNEFIPALRHNCFVDSWQSALKATTVMIVRIGVQMSDVLDAYWVMES